MPASHPAGDRHTLRGVGRLSRKSAAPNCPTVRRYDKLTAASGSRVNQDHKRTPTTRACAYRPAARAARANLQTPRAAACSSSLARIKERRAWPAPNDSTRVKTPNVQAMFGGYRPRADGENLLCALRATRCGRPVPARLPESIIDYTDPADNLPQANCDRGGDTIT